MLSGYSLDTLSKQLKNYKIRKLVGNLDYNLIRHTKTLLTEKELQYVANDVKCVMAYIAELIESDGGISRIPLTKTGYVRNYCRNACYYEIGVPRNKSMKRQRYLELMRAMTLNVDEYKLLKDGFMGGFTHSNPFNTNKVLIDVASFDFTSSYPTVMIAEKFPMSEGEQVEIHNEDELIKNFSLYCCIFDCEIINLEPKFFNEYYISSSRCKVLINATIYNGRVVRADRLVITITEQDFKIIHAIYSMKTIRVKNFIRYKKGYLPTDFIKSILKLYQDKTTLKGVQGKENEYLVSKGMLNSCYGMAVTDIVRNTIVYDGDLWSTESPDYEKMIKKYNNSPSRFLFYPWGVWVTAYARTNLFSGILECGEDYIYADTDSIKILNYKKHLDYINTYNKRILDKLRKALDFHGLEYELIEPKTIKGVKKPLGIWDFEGCYKRFKTLGAKRYMYEDNEGIHITVAGLPKSSVLYLCKSWGYTLSGNELNSPFEVFTDDMYVPSDYTNKLTHTYIDNEREGVVIDYLGVKSSYHERSSVHLWKQDFNLSLHGLLDYLDSITEN